MPHHVLVIGGGSIGERHLRCFLQTDRAVVSLCEIRPDVRRELTAKYPIHCLFDKIDAALTVPPGAVVICTPAQFHVPIATQFANAGVHLLIEKPLGVGMDGVVELQSVVQAQSLVAAVAYVYRSHPVLAAMRDAVRDGRFGKPVQLVVAAGQHFPHYRPAYRDIYYNNRETGGGAIQDALTHLINAGEWFIGPVTQLAADADHQALPGVDVEDTVHVIARHGDVMASYSLNQHQAPNEATITLVCENGTARFAMHECSWSWVTHPEQPWQTENHPPLERDTLFLRQANTFLDCIEGKCEPQCTLEEGVQTLRVNLAVLRAAEMGTWQTITQQ